MNQPKFWVYAPLELIKHAENHLESGEDFDRRMALISYDNAIEISITTYLQLPPSERDGIRYDPKQIEKWLDTYHTKLNYFEIYLKQSKIPHEYTLGEILHYHDLRNEVYHSGNGMVPAMRALKGIRGAALWVFSNLFGINPEEMLKESAIPPPKAIKQEEIENSLPKLIFQQSLISLEKIIAKRLKKHRLVGKNEKYVSFDDAWKRLNTVFDIPKDFTKAVTKSLKIRNLIARGYKMEVSKYELLNLSEDLNKIINYFKETDELGVGKILKKSLLIDILALIIGIPILIYIADTTPIQEKLLLSLLQFFGIVQLPSSILIAFLTGIVVVGVPLFDLMKLMKELDYKNYLNQLMEENRN